MSPNITSFALSVAEAAIVQPWLWFAHMLSVSGLTGTFLAALVMYLAFKFLIAPFMGISNASSDTAEKRKKGKK